MIDIISVSAIIILLILVICSLFPLVPSGILSSLTVIIYWWYSGYSEPSVLVVVSLVILGILVEITDFMSGIIAGKLGGASSLPVMIGTVIGLILMFVIGPIGFILGISCTVFIYSYYNEEDTKKEALKKSGYTVVGVLASNVVQIIMLLVLTATFGFFVIY